ncbi:site-specific integrase [uncultured Bacteroides sp.]|uniref:site-specific integrase n=1 Tax=uncultured Bacteroides sp. TaxID=162156 RepID=UPI00261EDA5A|nr:site-specific integrase [uncultured Bacteroides sp.]
MPRVKKPTKVKEPIRLRTKKLSDGSKSLYLDIYRNGKRTYEYLKMYLIPETDRNARLQNEVTMTAANAIKSKRIIELTSGEAGIVNHRDKIYLLDWMDTYKEFQEKRNRKKCVAHIKTVVRLLKEYAGERVILDQIDMAFCQGYVDYMMTSYRPKGKPIAASTQHTYYLVFTGALNAAVRAKRLLRNPFNEMDKSEKPKKPESVRSYMTIDEVRALIATPIKNEMVKNAYLFSCFCGLRISDIIGLKWKDIFVDRGQYRLALSMQKTKEPIYLPLSPEALKWMPERGDKTESDPVFKLPTAINARLKPWAKAAGITKQFTFHTARHTFATMMLTLGADLYTVSKLLGHADVRMTQVYAKIVNEKKDEAVNLTNGLFD